MRVSATKGDVSVHATAGTYAVILGMDAARGAAKGLLGFAIHREDHTENEAYWLRGQLTFRETAHPAADYSAFEHPFQDFKWGDYTAKPGHRYTYQIVPVYGTPKRLQHGAGVEVTVETESETDAVHRIYFNRGALASQAFERKFGVPTKAALSKPGNPALPWLSRGLEEALLDFIAQAKGGWGLRAAFYEFTYGPVQAALKAAAQRGADVKIVVDHHGDPIREENEPAIRAARFPKGMVIARDGVGQGIGHNKFMVLLKGQQPVAVWTGSTNLTLGGIFGQSNVGHAVWDAQVAATYLTYWEEVSGNPARRDFAPWNDTHTPVAPAEPHEGTQVLFSPRGSLDALEWYATEMDKARQGVFLTAAFGVSNEFAAVLTKRKPYLRYVLMENRGQTSNQANTAKILANPFNRVALGSTIPTGALADWHAESVGDVNTHVKYIHTKYMLIDPLGSQPTVISGSANFSAASTTNNDENMLVVRGDTRVADVYLSEFMRLFAHYYFRDRVAEAEAAEGKGRGKTAQPKASSASATGGGPPAQLFLKSDDSWTAKYYAKGSPREKERLYFAGKAG